MNDAPIFDPIRIGKLARMAGCSIPTIRYYEEIGLIPPASRRSSGQRVYDLAACKCLHLFDAAGTLAKPAISRNNTSRPSAQR